MDTPLWPDSLFVVAIAGVRTLTTRPIPVAKGSTEWYFLAVDRKGGPVPLHLLTAGSDPDGTLFGIDTDGSLRWYQYSWESGGGTVAAGLAPWLREFAANSGNPIGIGWGEFRWIGAGVHGTLLGIDGHGVLHRYYYTGKGERDDGGNSNWAPQSSSPLVTFGDDWKQFALIFNISDPDTPFKDEELDLVAVNSDGEVWLYLFNDGNPRPGSPVLLTSGWTDYRYVFGGNLGRIFAVDSAGVLHWFGVTFTFNDDLTFTAALAPGSGNAIGKGWDQFTSASCTLTGLFETSPIYAIDSGHNLRWFNYIGDGHLDPDGATGWAPGSNTIISGSW
jgi:hypothetical protein